MFKGDYKKHYDQLHPSPELIEKTKRLALEQCHLMQSDENTEKYEKKEEEIVFGRLEEQKLEENGRNVLLGMTKKKVYQIAAGLAASVAVVVTGILISGNLKEKSYETPMVIVSSQAPKEEQEKEVLPTTRVDEKIVEEKENKKDKKKTNNDGEKMSVSQMAGLSRGENAQLDYASDSRVIVHGNFGILVYDLPSQQIVVQISPDKYMLESALFSEIITVSNDGNYIQWYNAVSSTGEARSYNISTGELTTKRMFESGTSETDMESSFYGLQEVAGTEADIYLGSCINGDMVSLGDGRYCQLVYQAPESPLQASLGISIIDINQKEEKIYPVFGSVGEQLVKKQGIEYGNFYNERGQELFGNNEKSENIETATPQVTIVPEATNIQSQEVITETDYIEATPEVTTSPTEIPTKMPEETMIVEP